MSAYHLETDRGFLLTIEHGDALEIAIEEGYGLRAQNDDDLLCRLAGLSLRGEGQPTLINYSDRTLQIKGLSVHIQKSFLPERAFAPAAGHAHLILQDVITDIEGTAFVPIAPKLRTSHYRTAAGTGRCYCPDAINSRRCRRKPHRTAEPIFLHIEL